MKSQQIKRRFNLITDDITLIANNQKISGWESVSITRGIEICPSHFDFTMTEFYPGETEKILVKPGDSCVVKIGNDTVITGYVNRYIPSITPTSHTIRIVGRGKCQDLVDCSAEYPHGQITESTVLVIAQKLAHYYGIKVVEIGAEGGKPIKQLNQIRGETAYQIIERICRWRAPLCYELADGSLCLSRAGTSKMSSGFTEGQNAQFATMSFSDDQRFFEYQGYLISARIFGDISPVNEFTWVELDGGISRNRKLMIIAETGDPEGGEVLKKRVTWECNRRIGRGNQLTLTADSWRDKKGKLWEPNSLVLVDFPNLRINKKMWLISEVTYHLDDNGTTADLVIMPPQAFDVQPINLMPGMSDFVPENKQSK